MKTAINRFVNRSANYMNLLGRSRARHHLLAQSDRMLADAGFSRELLEQGVKAWPWQEAASIAPAPIAVTATATPDAGPTGEIPRAILLDRSPERETDEASVSTEAVSGYSPTRRDAA